MTLPTTATLAGTGSYLPETRLDNYGLYAIDSIRESFDVERARHALRDVEDPAALSPEEVFDRWARQVTGIASRCVLTPESGLTTEDMCAAAGRRALEAAGMQAADLDLVLVASLTGAEEVPNQACTVASRLGAPRLGGYTLNAACAGFVYAVAAGWAAIRSGLARHVLAVSGDALTRVTDYADPKTAVVFGDGAGAAVLVPSDGEEGILGVPVLGGEYAREPLYLVGQGWQMPEEPDPKIHMEGGPRILRNAIVSMAEIAGQALESAGRRWSEVDVVIPHQANLRITTGLEKHLTLERGRVVHNISDRGNMSASTVGVTLDEVLRGRHGELPDPALLVLTAIGGGYTTAATVIRLGR